MDFSYSAEQQALDELARQVLGPQAERLEVKRTAERDAREGGPGVDEALWSDLAGTGMLAAFTDADAASVVAAALVARAHGASLAPIPVWQTLAALLGLGPDVADPSVAAAIEAVTSGHGWATVALVEPGARSAVPRVVDGRLSGTVPLVPAALGAAWALVAAESATGCSLYWVDLAGHGVELVPTCTTDLRSAASVAFRDAAAVCVGDAAASRRVRWITDTLISATQAGVVAAAIDATSTYLTVRHQFGRPLSSFQAPVHRLVDAFIDNDALWLTTLSAAWRLDDAGDDGAHDDDVAIAVDIAKWWAADAGSRAVHTTQHLHGGIGADVDYPVHRSFLWAKTLADLLGGAASHAADLGDLLAARVAP